MPKAITATLALLATIAIASWGVPSTSAKETDRKSGKSQPKSNDGWEVLFDGTSTDAFRSWKRNHFPKSGWEIAKDGSLHAKDRSHDIITRKKYSDFDLRLEWKLSSRANSGIMYRVSEQGGAPHSTGPEYQLIDDKRIHKSSTGSLYGLIQPSGKVKLNPAGQWNTTRIVMHKNKVQHYLNGQLVVEYVWGSEDIKKRIAKSKFKKWKGFMQQPTGHIAIQSHGKELWFRNIRIKDLSK